MASGDVASFGTPSDIQLKDNITPIVGALDKVLGLNGYEYEWNGKAIHATFMGVKKDIGVIAQEVEQVFPQLVRMGDNGYLTVRERGLTAVLIEAMKEQQSQIVELRNEIEKLKNS